MILQRNIREASDGNRNVLANNLARVIFLLRRAIKGSRWRVVAEGTCHVNDLKLRDVSSHIACYQVDGVKRSDDSQLSRVGAAGQG